MRTADLSIDTISFGWNATMAVRQTLRGELETGASMILMKAAFVSLTLSLPVGFLLVGITGNLRRQFALSGSRPLRSLVLGLFLGGGLVLASDLLSWIMTRLGAPLREQLWVDAALDLEGAFLWVVIVTIVLLAPVGEELFFRGYVFRVLLQDVSRAAAYVASTALFAAMHFHPVGLPFYILVGLVLAASIERTGSLIPAVTAHIVVNVTAVTQYLVASSS